jgi:hypothetical protein
MTLRTLLARIFGPFAGDHTIAAVGVHDRHATARAAQTSHGRPIDEWVQERTGKSADAVTTRDLLELPRPSGLRYDDSMVSRLGGRLDRHLMHLSDEEAAELQREGDEFLDATPSDAELPSVREQC